MVLNIHSLPRAILHVDADAFFASVEQATTPELKGKPVVVGRERGIVTAVSYEGKALGIKRGMTIAEVKRRFPQAVILDSDYEKYSLFSLRMFDILREFTPDVEEYSIDEAFADLTGLRRLYRCGYEGIALAIKERIKKELGITVSLGISLTKVLAKIASSWQKPDGLTIIPGREIHNYLSKLPVSEVWGIGPKTSALCEKLNLKTALDLALKTEDFIKKYFDKRIHEIWLELRGIPVYPVDPTSKSSYKSISKALSFTPTSNRDFLLSQIAFNLELACFKARAYGLRAKRVILGLKDEDFNFFSEEIDLPQESAYPLEVLPHLREAFSRLYRDGKLYRQVVVVLSGLTSNQVKQRSLFEDTIRSEKIEKLYQGIDSLSGRYGRTIVSTATSLFVVKEKPLKRKDSLRIPLLPLRLS
jgi:Nucleotidyltransferase/DNA polymerase involved in DNA repair